jgi:hypothetical protein
MSATLIVDDPTTPTTPSSTPLSTRPPTSVKKKKKTQDASIQVPDKTGNVPLTFVVGSCRQSYHAEYFRFTETGRQTIMSDLVNDPKKFFGQIRKLYNITVPQVKMYYLYSPMRYPILERAYMRFQPKALNKLLGEIGIIRYVYFIGWDYETDGGRKLKRTRWDIVISDQEILGREELVVEKEQDEETAVEKEQDEEKVVEKEQGEEVVDK